MANLILLSDVEACALGVVWQHGPCTAYAVRKEFAASHTPRWSASAGSIYPVLRRLVERRLVRPTAEDWGPRSRTRFALTARGLAALRRWVAPPFDAALAGPPYDPLRTRSCFLDARSPAQRIQFVHEAVRATRAALAALRDANPDSTFERLARRGSVLALAARLRGLDELAAAVGCPPTLPGTRPDRG
jgi:DNA-binding PadR family transcriptional regulator